MNWDLATDIALYAAVAVLGIFAGLGLSQWVTRGSIKKVDKALIYLLVPLVLMVIVYIVFDKLWILNTRPDGSGEPSFPSTHTMVVTTIFCCTMLLLPRYVKQKPYYIILDIFLFAFIIFTAVGRVLADKHWPSDVVAGMIFGGIFTAIYGFIVKKSQKSQNSRKVDQKPAENAQNSRKISQKPAQTHKTIKKESNE